VVDYLAAQLGIEDPSVVKRYTERLPTQHEHAREIRDLYGFRDFSDPSAAAGLREFVAGRAWTHTEGQLALFTQAVAWLHRHRVLLPGASVLARLVASVREDAADRMHRTLTEAAAGADPEMPARLLGLLRVVDGQRFSELERLRRSPTRTSGRAMTAALDRVSDVLSVGARAAVTPTVPANRFVTLARYGLTAKAPAIKLLAEPRRTATLLATAQAMATRGGRRCTGPIRRVDGDPADQRGEAIVGVGEAGVDAAPGEGLGDAGPYGAGVARRTRQGRRRCRRTA
jgi:hypothetical protein